MGLELSVKKVASGKFFSAGAKASFDQRRFSDEAARDPLFTPALATENRNVLRLFFFQKQAGEFPLASARYE